MTTPQDSPESTGASHAQRQTVTPHGHVTLDEAVFWGYQDVADIARRTVAGQSDGASLRFCIARLDAALEASHADNEIDPRHHVASATNRTSACCQARAEAVPSEVAGQDVCTWPDTDCWLNGPGPTTCAASAPTENEHERPVDE